MAEKLPVNLSVCLVFSHVNQIPQVSHKNSLENILVEITGIVVVTGLHQNTGHCQPPASNWRLQLTGSRRTGKVKMRRALLQIEWPNRMHRLSSHWHRTR